MTTCNAIKGLGVAACTFEVGHEGKHSWDCGLTQAVEDDFYERVALLINESDLPYLLGRAVEILLTSHNVSSVEEALECIQMWLNNR